MWPIVFSGELWAGLWMGERGRRFWWVGVVFAFRFLLGGATGDLSRDPPPDFVSSCTLTSISSWREEVFGEIFASGLCGVGGLGLGGVLRAGEGGEGRDLILGRVWEGFGEMGGRF